MHEADRAAARGRRSWRTVRAEFRHGTRCASPSQSAAQHTRAGPGPIVHPHETAFEVIPAEKVRPLVARRGRRRAAGVGDHRRRSARRSAAGAAGPRSEAEAAGGDLLAHGRTSSWHADPSGPGPPRRGRRAPIGVYGSAAAATPDGGRRDEIGGRAVAITDRAPSRRDAQGRAGGARREPDPRRGRRPFGDPIPAAAHSRLAGDGDTLWAVGTEPPRTRRGRATGSARQRQLHHHHHGRPRVCSARELPYRSTRVALARRSPRRRPSIQVASRSWRAMKNRWPRGDDGHHDIQLRRRRPRAASRWAVARHPAS